MYKIVLFSLVFIFIGLHNYQPVAAKEADEPFTIYPGTELTLKKEGDSRNYRTTFTIWGSDQTIKVRQFVPNDLVHQNHTDDGSVSISAQNISIALDATDDTADENKLPMRFNVAVTLPSGVHYPQGKYQGDVLFIFDTNQILILTLSMVHLPNPNLELVSSLPLRLSAELKETVTRSLSLHETTGVINAQGITVTSVIIEGIEDTNVNLPSDVVQVAESISIIQGGREDFRLDFNFGNKGVQAGAFSGKLFLSGENTNELQVPLELSLKHRWIWPTVVLVVSIFFGFILNLYTTVRQERDKLLTHIRRERDKLTKISAAPNDSKDTKNPFYEMYDEAIKQQLSWAEEELKKSNPNIAAAEQYLGKIGSFKAFCRINRYGLFSDLLTLKRRIDYLLNKIDPSIYNEYTYIAQIKHRLLLNRDKLPGSQTQEEYTEISDTVEEARNELQLFLAALEDLENVSDRISPQDQGENNEDQEVIKKLKDRIGEARKALQDATEATTVDEITGIRDSLIQIEREYGEVYQGDLNALSEQPSNGETSYASVEWAEWPQEHSIEWERLDVEYSDNLFQRFRRFLRDTALMLPLLRLWSYRTLLALATLLVLGYLGLSELYLNDPIFGDTLPSDYLQLVLWGIGSNATQEGIFQLIGSIGTRLQSARSQPTDPVTEVGVG